MNFLANAADALNKSRTSPQDSEGQILIEARTLESTWEFSVSDNGPGLPPEIAKEIFEPYFTTKPHTEGTGLGLAIAHTIIQEHQGSVRVDRHPTLGGARFLVRLPQASIIAK
jgi:C4-dicarboxylate-specific signal transduction histidine kinase